MSRKGVVGEPFHTTLQVRWGDFDQLGHVNNVRFVEYAQEARILFFRSRLRGQGLGPFTTVVRRSEIEHLRPLLRGTTAVEVEISVESFGTTSFMLLQTIRDSDGDTCCEIRSVMVYVDNEQHLPTEITQDARQALTATPTRAALEQPEGSEGLEVGDR